MLRLQAVRLEVVELQPTDPAPGTPFAVADRGRLTAPKVIGNDRAVVPNVIAAMPQP